MKGKICKRCKGRGVVINLPKNTGGKDIFGSLLSEKQCPRCYGKGVIN